MATVATPNITPVTASCPVLPAGALAITTSDVDAFASPVSVYVGGAGVVSCVPVNGNAAVSVTVPAGQMVPFRVSQVLATGTTATLLIAIY